MVSSYLSHGEIHLIGPLTPGRGTSDMARASPHPSERDEDWDRVKDSLLRIRRLDSDWDGQGAEAPAPTNVDAALEWTRQMRNFPQAIPPSRAIPGVAGEVYLEWQSDSLSLTAEISEPLRVEWTLAVPGQPTKHWLTEGAIPYFVSSAR
jgi:hypothetical protein